MEQVLAYVQWNGLVGIAVKPEDAAQGASRSVRMQARTLMSQWMSLSECRCWMACATSISTCTMAHRSTATLVLPRRLWNTPFFMACRRDAWEGRRERKRGWFMAEGLRHEREGCGGALRYRGAAGMDRRTAAAGRLYVSGSATQMLMRRHQWLSRAAFGTQDTCRTVRPHRHSVPFHGAQRPCAVCSAPSSHTELSSHGYMPGPQTTLPVARLSTLPLYPSPHSVRKFSRTANRYPGTAQHNLQAPGYTAFRSSAVLRAVCSPPPTPCRCTTCRGVMITPPTTRRCIPPPYPDPELPSVHPSTQCCVTTNASCALGSQFMPFYVPSSPDALHGYLAFRAYPLPLSQHSMTRTVSWIVDRP